MKFKPQDEPRLAKLSDEDLIQHLVKARDAGDHDQFRLATNILVSRRFDHVFAKVGLKVPEQDVEDVAMSAITSAISSFNFRGSSIGEFVSCLNTIVKYRIADYYRLREKSPQPEALGGIEGDGSFGPAPIDGEKGIELIDLETLIDDLLSERTAVHRRVIELKIEGYSAKETAVMVGDETFTTNGASADPSGMTAANADTIYHRFRKDLKKAIEESERF